jgi:hypothetical protein
MLATQLPKVCIAALLCRSSVALANEAHDIISRMSEAKRNSTFTTCMQRSGEACRTVGARAVLPAFGTSLSTKALPPR